MAAIDNRFWSKVAPAGPLDCWQWTACTTAEGYGLFAGGGNRLVGAHRWSYEALRAEIPAGLVIDHLCRNRACVNPWHLEPVSTQVNVLRGQPYIKRSASCPHGHEYTEANTYRSPRGYRQCRTCNRERVHRAYIAKKAAQ